MPIPEDEEEEEDAVLDALVVGGGPAGLTAAIYLARFERRFLLVDAGDPRAAWIPESHNIPFFGGGIPGPEIRDAGVRRPSATARASSPAPSRRCASGPPAAPALTRISSRRGVAARGAAASARRVLLATGAVDVEPGLPDLPDAVRRGLVRYCPICGGKGDRIAALHTGDGTELRFDVLYSAQGCATTPSSASRWARSRTGPARCTSIRDGTRGGCSRRLTSAWMKPMSAACCATPARATTSNSRARLRPGAAGGFHAVHRQCRVPARLR